jgi:hypothetical protein
MSRLALTGLLDAGLAGLPRRLWRQLRGKARRRRHQQAGERVLDQLADPVALGARDFEHLARMRIKHLVPVREPLVLISQLQRSGGTLLSQLFDRHPQCHAHPGELRIGKPAKWNWPVLDPADGPDVWFRTLFEKTAFWSFQQGFTKFGVGATNDHEVYPFLFLPSLQRLLFDHCLAEAPAPTVRDILDGYMTSYFNAWLDNHNLYGGPKRIIAAFVPRMTMDPANLERFFGVYPDGRLISIVRDARSWFASARKHQPALYGDMAAAISLWIECTRSIVDAKRRYPSRVVVLCFDDLLDRTEPVMRALADVLGLEFEPSLLAPTFNGLPIKANSSYEVAGHGVLKEPLGRFRRELAPGELESIEARTTDVYGAALALALRC